MVDFKKIKKIIVEYEYLDTKEISSYTQNIPSLIRADDMSLSAPLLSDERSEKGVVYDVKIINKKGNILIGGSVISDSHNVYSARLREEKDAYVLESEDTSQKATVLLYLS